MAVFISYSPVMSGSFQCDIQRIAVDSLRCLRGAYVDAVQPRHSYIQKNQIRAQLIDQGYRSNAVGSFPHSFQPVFTVQEVFDCLRGQRFVFNDNRANRLGSSCQFAGDRFTGVSMILNGFHTK